MAFDFAFGGVVGVAMTTASVTGGGALVTAAAVGDVVVVVAVVIWLFNVFGLFHSLSSIHIGKG